MNLRYIKRILPAALMVTLLWLSASCVGDLDVKPINPSVTQEFHQDEIFAKIYSTLANTGQKGPDGEGDLDGIDEGTSSFYRLLWTLNVIPTDEGICAWMGNEGVPELNDVKWGASHDQVTGLYARLNFDVTLCNHFLEETEGATDDHTLKQRAEVRFMRALNFYYLMDFFGNIPFTEVVTDEPPQQILRADLFNYIEKELVECESDMYDVRQAPYGRADKVANWLLRSRMYLNAEVYTGTAKWNEAAEYAKKVMDSSYSLAPVYAHLFMADNDDSGSVNRAKQEIILPIRQHGTYMQGYGGSFFVVAATRASGMPAWGSTDGWEGNRARAALAEKFFPSGNVPEADDLTVAAGDDRAMLYSTSRTVTISDVANFREGVSVVKFSGRRADGGGTSDPKFTDTDVPFMRLAEAYLNYAEALFRTNNAPGALTIVNELRARSNASALANLTEEVLLDERAREFFFEGHRRTDLIRFGRFGGTNSYLWDWKGGVAQGTTFAATYNLYPIPNSDMVANPNLVQNPGY